MSQGEGGLWTPGKPDAGNNGQCLWLGNTFDRRFDDIDCDYAFFQICTICEKNAPTTTNAPITTTNAPITTTNAPTTTTSYEFNCSNINDDWILARLTSGPDFYVQ